MSVSVDPLAAVFEQIRALRADVHRLSGLSADHLVKLAALLPAIAANIGERVFAAPELASFASSKLEGAAALRLALECATGELGPSTARRVGKLLARGAGVDVLGLRIEQVGADRDGAIWAIRGTSPHHREKLGPFSRPVP